MELNLNLEETTSNQNNNNYYNENELNRNMFEFIYVIGKGGFGKVWKVQYKKTKEYYALKEMSKRKILDKNSEKSINSERKFLSLLNHPFIVNMHYAFQDNDNLYLVIDMLSGGDLRYHCSRYRIFSEEQTRFFIACILYSLEYIHSNNVIHRDIKPENLVLDEKGYARITDFGIAKDNMLDNSSETSGTPGYMSPEVMNGNNHSFQTDFFAVGVIGYEFLIGNRPFDGKSRKEIKEKMLSEKIMINIDNIKKGWSIDVADFINRLLERKQEKRLGAVGGVKELKEHQWLKYYPWEELEKKMLPAPFIPEEIDNFDKSFCESIEKISEETKIRYQKIFISSKYKEAFIDFYYNKDKPKFQRKSIKSHRLVINKNTINNLINNQSLISTEKEKSNNIEDKKNNNINNNNGKSIPHYKYLLLGSFNTKKKKINNISEENKEKFTVDEVVQNDNNDNKNNSLEIENDKSNDFSYEKFIDENDEQKLNNLIKKNININSDNKLYNESKKPITHYNLNNIPKINKYKKILINNTNHIKKVNEDNFLKEYIKFYNDKRQKKVKTKNYYLLNIKNKDNNINHYNYFTNKKSSSLVFFSPRTSKNKNNKIEFSISNNNSKKMLENNKSSPFKYYLLNNNSNSNLLFKNSDNKIKYQKNMKKNNSFRINYIKNFNKGDKNVVKRFYNINSLNNQNEYLKNSKYYTNNLDKKFIQKKIFKLNFHNENKLFKKMKLLINNNNSSSNNNSDNMSLNQSNNFYTKKLYNTNNYNIKYSNNNISNLTKKEKSFNFRRKMSQFKLNGNNNNLLNYNYFSNITGLNSNTNVYKKHLGRAYSVNDYKNMGNKLNKFDNRKNINIIKNSNRKYNSSSNNKNRIPFFISF